MLVSYLLPGTGPCTKELLMPNKLGSITPNRSLAEIARAWEIVSRPCLVNDRADWLPTGPRQPCPTAAQLHRSGQASNSRLEGYLQPPPDARAPICRKTCLSSLLTRKQSCTGPPLPGRRCNPTPPSLVISSALGFPSSLVRLSPRPKFSGQTPGPAALDWKGISAKKIKVSLGNL